MVQRHVVDPLLGEGLSSDPMLGNGGSLDGRKFIARIYLFAHSPKDSAELAFYVFGVYVLGQLCFVICSLILHMVL